MNNNTLENIADLKTTIPGLYTALCAVLVSFNVHLPALPDWVPTAIGAVGTVVGVYLAAFVKSHKAE